MTDHLNDEQYYARFPAIKSYPTLNFFSQTNRGMTICSSSTPSDYSQSVTFIYSPENAPEIPVASSMMNIHNRIGRNTPTIHAEPLNNGDRSLFFSFFDYIVSLIKALFGFPQEASQMDDAIASPLSRTEELLMRLPTPEEQMTRFSEANQRAEQRHRYFYHETRRYRILGDIQENQENQPIDLESMQVVSYQAPM